MSESEGGQASVVRKGEGGQASGQRMEEETRGLEREKVVGKKEVNGEGRKK